jgi:hypothetical protein
MLYSIGILAIDNMREHDCRSEAACEKNKAFYSFKYTGGTRWVDVFRDFPQFMEVTFASNRPFPPALTTTTMSTPPPPFTPSSPRTNSA